MNKVKMQLNQKIVLKYNTLFIFIYTLFCPIRTIFVVLMMLVHYPPYLSILVFNLLKEENPFTVNTY